MKPRPLVLVAVALIASACESSPDLTCRQATDHFESCDLGNADFCSDESLSAWSDAVLSLECGELRAALGDGKLDGLRNLLEALGLASKPIGDTCVENEECGDASCRPRSTDPLDPNTCQKHGIERMRLGGDTIPGGLCRDQQLCNLGNHCPDGSSCIPVFCGDLCDDLKDCGPGMVCGGYDPGPGMCVAATRPMPHDWPTAVQVCVGVEGSTQ